MIGSKTGAANAEQRVRFAEMHDLGCLACRLQGVGWVPPEIDHMNVGDHAGMPRTEGGHDDTLPFCRWHHRGEPHEGYSQADCLRIFGPSKHLHKKRFIEAYGTLEELREKFAVMLERHRERTRVRPIRR